MKNDISKGSKGFPKFDQEGFNRFILDNKVIGFFDVPITLKSGRLSHWYVNWRTISEDVWLLDQASDWVLSFVNLLLEKKELDDIPHSFFGVPEGATKLSILTQYKWAKNSKDFGAGTHSLSMGRGRIKEHGALKDRNFLGVPKGRTIVLEDVTTTGASLLDTIEVLKDTGVTILAALGLTDRMERRDDRKTVSESLEERFGVPYFALSSALDLLPRAVALQKPTEDILRATEQEFAIYGVKPIRLI